jgi:hypothetical protein
MRRVRRRPEIDLQREFLPAAACPSDGTQGATSDESDDGNQQDKEDDERHEGEDAGVDGKRDRAVDLRGFESNDGDHVGLSVLHGYDRAERTSNGPISRAPFQQGALIKGLLRKSSL